MNLVSRKMRNSSTPMGSYVYSNYDFYKPATPSGSNTSICKTVVHPHGIILADLRGKCKLRFLLHDEKISGVVLIVDDDDHVIITSRMILKQYFENIESLNSPKTLETRLRQHDVDVVLLDMNFEAGVTSGNEGIFWMNRIRTLSPHTQVVLQTAYGDIELAVKSIKEGAVDFEIKVDVVPKRSIKKEYLSAVEKDIVYV